MNALRRRTDLGIIGTLGYAERGRLASEKAVHPATTGNEDPGSEVEDLREERERAIRQRERP